MTLSSIQTRATQDSFSFSYGKTVCHHFCNKRGPNPDPAVTLKGHLIPLVAEITGGLKIDSMGMDYATLYHTTYGLLNINTKENYIEHRELY